MSHDRSYVAKNAAELARLRRLVTTVSDAELARPMPAGWTVASVLGHLAFWDQRIVALLDAWQAGGMKGAPPSLHQDNVDWINDATKPLLLVAPPRQVAEVTLAIAETVDRRVESLADSALAANAAAGSPLNLLRAEHRGEHLDEIEHALGRRFTA
jgi:hypothetical protein